MFEIGYDNHPLVSESNMTPVQLWLYGRQTILEKGHPQKKTCHHLALTAMCLSLKMSTMGTLGKIYQFKSLKLHARNCG